VAGALVQQAHPQDGCGLHQGGELQVGQNGREAGGQVQEQHLGDGGVARAPLGRRHAQQHARGGGVMLLTQIAVQVCGRQAIQVACPRVLSATVFANLYPPPPPPMKAQEEWILEDRVILGRISEIKGK